MKKASLLVFVLLTFCMMTSKAQKAGCGLPTCEEPADPGLSAEKTRKFVVYPNPSNGRINLQFQEEVTSSFSIVITDASGKTVYRKSIDPKDNLLHPAIDLTAQSSGLYFVKMIRDREIQLTKALILH